MGVPSVFKRFFCSKGKYRCMWRVSLALIVLIYQYSSVYAQEKRHGSKGKPTPEYVQLPIRSTDCFYAIALQVGQVFGPTTPPQGSGFEKEGVKDPYNPHLLEEERNSVWYKVEIPYSGKLYFTLTPQSEIDNYDFVVYKYTDRYFCNRVHHNGIKALRVNKSLPDTKHKGATGLSLTSKTFYAGTRSSEAFSSYIDVLKGETYYILVTSDNDQGLGHSILVEVDTKFIPLHCSSFDGSGRKRTPADYFIKEIETGRVIANIKKRTSYRAKLVPNYNYQLTVKKEGYFDHMATLFSTDYQKDSILNISLTPIKKGSLLPLMGEIYFNEKQDEILTDSHPALDRIVEIMNESPSMEIEIIGNVNSNGFEPEKDLLISALRANTVKIYLVNKGIAGSRITTRGMTKKELEKSIVAIQKNPKLGNTPNCQIKITDYKQPKKQ